MGRPDTGAVRIRLLSTPASPGQNWTCSPQARLPCTAAVLSAAGHRAADHDHAFGTDLIGELRKVGQRRPVRNAQPGRHLGLLAHDASDSVTELRLVGEHLPDGRGVLVGPYQHDGLQEVPAPLACSSATCYNANAER